MAFGNFKKIRTGIGERISRELEKRKEMKMLEKEAEEEFLLENIKKLPDSELKKLSMRQNGLGESAKNEIRRRIETRAIKKKEAKLEAVREKAKAKVLAKTVEYKMKKRQAQKKKVGGLAKGILKTGVEFATYLVSEPTPTRKRKKTLTKKKKMVGKKRRKQTDTFSLF